MYRESRDILQTIGMDIDPATRVSELSVGQRQVVEIAKALSAQSKVIVMDEPTASLSHHETGVLLALVKRLRERGLAVVYISHWLEEIFELADRVTVLRDGRTVNTAPIAQVTRESLVREMVDRELSELYGEPQSHASGEPVLEVRGLSLNPVRAAEARIRDIGFTLHRGEVLGIAGLVGRSWRRSSACAHRPARCSSMACP